MLKDVKYKNYCFKIVKLEYSHILYCSYYLDAHTDIRISFCPFGSFILSVFLVCLQTKLYFAITLH